MVFRHESRPFQDQRNRQRAFVIDPRRAVVLRDMGSRYFHSLRNRSAGTAALHSVPSRFLPRTRLCQPRCIHDAWNAATIWRQNRRVAFETDRHPSFSECSHLRPAQPANLQFISCANGFPAEWRPGWDHGVSYCRIDLEGSNMSTRMRISGGKLKRTRARSIFAPPSRQMISGSARRDRSTDFYSSVTLLSRNSGSVADSFASGTNHGSKFLRRSKSRLII